MAKKQRKKDDLFDLARAGGLRKRVAKTISEAGGSTGKKSRKSAEKAVTNLRSMLDELEDRATGGPRKRREAALKAARTRRRKAAARSNAAKKGARTRAKS
jgi:hypothetical protein